MRLAVHDGPSVSLHLIAAVQYIITIIGTTESKSTLSIDQSKKHSPNGPSRNPTFQTPWRGHVMQRHQPLPRATRPDTTRHSEVVPTDRVLITRFLLPSYIQMENEKCKSPLYQNHYALPVSTLLSRAQSASTSQDMIQYFKSH
jgi:hypothetical protein